MNFFERSDDLCLPQMLKMMHENLTNEDYELADFVRDANLLINTLSELTCEVLTTESE